MAKFELSKIVTVPNLNYPIVIGSDLLNSASCLDRYCQSGRLMVVSDEQVAPLYLQRVIASLPGAEVHSLVLPCGEKAKTQASVNLIYESLLAERFARDTLLIALGGGVIGDMTGFAASTYMRGIPYVQMPTTLLAQVDASIGGKTAINLPQGKNLIGSFYQPRAVIIDLLTLHTLPAREFNAGLAEIIKYGLLAGGDLYDMIDENLAPKEAFLANPVLDRIIAACCQLKADIVAEDEKETGRRALLNLGHTFAHALEAQTQYQRWLHGEAVAIGLYCAALLSEALGYLSKAEVERLRQLLVRVDLPWQIPGDIDLSAMRALMAYDKKVKENLLRFVLIRSPGHCYIDDKISEDLLRHTLLRAVEGE